VTHSKVISHKNLPTRLPIWTTVTAGLLLDRFSSPDWVWGIVGTLFVIVWIVCIISIRTQDHVELKELQ
jgi:hypothetical protein